MTRPLTTFMALIAVLLAAVLTVIRTVSFNVRWAAYTVLLLALCGIVVVAVRRED